MKTTIKLLALALVLTGAVQAAPLANQTPRFFIIVDYDPVPPAPKKPVRYFWLSWLDRLLQQP